MNKKEQFDEYGYYVEKNIFDSSVMQEIFLLFYDISVNIAKKNQISLTHNSKISEIKYPDDIDKLDSLMLDIFAFDKNLLGEIYDTVSYSSTFLRFIACRDVEDLTK